MLESPESVRIADGRKLDAVAYGSVHLKMYRDKGEIQTTLKRVLHVPIMSRNLLSAGAITDNGFRVILEESECFISTKAGKVIGSGRRENQLYIIDGKAVLESNHAYVSMAQVSEADMWHRRLGHANDAVLKKLADGKVASGVSLGKHSERRFCEGRVLSKSVRTTPKPLGTKRTVRRLGVVHSDVCGPMNTETHSGKRYMVTFIDDYSRISIANFMRSKDETLAKLKEFVASVTGETGEKIGILHTDNGGEYTSREFRHYLIENKIEHETSSPNSPKQNGIAERMNRTLIEKAKAMIVHAGLPKFFWAEAVNTAVNLTNRIPTQALDGDITPFEKWYSRKPDLANLKVFGCVAYAHVPKQFRTKLDNKAVKIRFVGYSKGTKGYRLIDESTRRVVTRRDVTFDELTFDMTSGRSKQMGNSETASDEAAVESSGQAATGQNDDVVPAAEPNVVPEAVEAAVPDNTRPVRFRKPMVRYGIDEVYMADDDAMHEARCAVEMTEPKTMAEALRSPQAKEWKRAAVEEFNSLSEHETWELTELPVNRKTVGCK